jgi:hypothetical protein
MTGHHRTRQLRFKHPITEDGHSIQRHSSRRAYRAAYWDMRYRDGNQIEINRDLHR